MKRNLIAELSVLQLVRHQRILPDGWPRNLESAVIALLPGILRRRLPAVDLGETPYGTAAEPEKGVQGMKVTRSLALEEPLRLKWGPSPKKTSWHLLGQQQVQGEQLFRSALRGARKPVAV